MSDKKEKLQQDANRVINRLEELIDRIKSACIEPDIDTADRLFNNALLDLMMSIASAVMPENGIPPTYQRIREKYMQAV